MLDENTYTYVSKNGIVDLTLREYKLLKMLIDNKHRIVTYEEICQVLFNDKNDFCYQRCIYTVMSNLKKKCNNELPILLKRDVGYYLA